MVLLFCDRFGAGREKIVVNSDPVGETEIFKLIV